MKSSAVSRLPGMRDATGPTLHRARQVADRIARYLQDNGYGSVDTPLLEPSELFVRKSGGEFTSELYSFVDPGGQRVSLRPEFTSSVIRLFVQESGSLKIPVRWQYSGPVFRYEADGDGALRQHTQLGAELIGAAGPEADAEVLRLALGGLREAGISEMEMRVGHPGVYHDLLASFGLSGRATLFIVGNVQVLKQGGTGVAGLLEEANRVGILVRDQDGDDKDAANAARTEDGRLLVEGVMTEAMSNPVGRRTTEQIVQRLMRKMGKTDSIEKLREGLSLAEELAQVEGRPEAALARARDIASQHGLRSSTLDGLTGLLDALTSQGVGEQELLVDMGIARGIAYYSGVIFEVRVPSTEDGLLLAGGGRYDGLVRALGGDAVPALGFAYGLDRLAEALGDAGEKGTVASASPPRKR